MNHLKTFLGICTLSVVCGLCISTEAYAEDTVCEGVYVDEVSIGGKTKYEATELINEYIDGLKDKKVSIEANEKSVETTIGDLGYEGVENDYVEQALNIGKVGNLIQRYKDLKDVKYGTKIYETEFSYDESLVSSFVNDKCAECDIEAKEPSMSSSSGSIFNRDDISGAFSITSGEVGKIVDKDDALTKLKAKLDGWDKKDIVIEPTVKKEEPKYTESTLSECTTRLGTKTTTFSASNTTRTGNIKRASSLINGTVVYPDETFSILDIITPLTTANGYFEAGSYVSGKVVDSVGGGVCQVSTTLYNAVLAAELEIVSRSSHSMTVSYVDVSFDAMIASSAGIDFKFKNNTNVPIYIEGFVNGGSITFNVYGKETRSSNRTIEFANEITETIKPGDDVITKDSTKPASYKEITQSAHDGYKAKLYKIVYVNGKQTDKVLINSSTYKASPNYITIGNKADTDDVTDINDVVVDEDDIPLEDAAVAADDAGATTSPAQ